MRKARLLAESAQPSDTLFAKWLPIGWCEIDGFVDIEAMVEACVISLREGDDELPSMLIDRVD